MTKVFFFRAYLLLFLVFPVTGTSSASDDSFWNETYKPSFKAPTELARKNALRKELFNILRPMVSQEVSEPILFYGSLKAFKNWAFFVGSTINKNGDSINFPPVGSSDTVALWLRAKNGWVLVDFSVGHSDVFWEYWHDKYGAPLNLLGFQ